MMSKAVGIRPGVKVHDRKHDVVYLHKDYDETVRTTLGDRENSAVAELAEIKQKLGLTSLNLSGIASDVVAKVRKLFSQANSEEVK